MHWFPDRRFILAADGNYATHELARLAARFPGRLTFVSKFYPNANLYAPAPAYCGHGRRPQKGKELPSPAAVVAAPGAGYGAQGEGWVRFSLTVPDDRLEEAAARLRKALE